MRKNILSPFLVGAFILGLMTLLAPSSYAQSIVDGDLIRNPNASGDAKYDIYIVKLVGQKKFKRLILSPHVFDSYGHLSWDNVNLVDQTTMNQHITSDLVRCSDPNHGVNDLKVYRLNASGDSGSKNWMNMKADEFSAQYDPDSIYTINQVDRDAYMDISDWEIYTNEEYGYKLSFPQTWKDYIAKNRTLNSVSFGSSDSIDFGFSTQDSLFNISVYTKNQWQEIKSEEGPTPAYLGENSQYVFGYAIAQDAANDTINARMREIQDIIKTFRFTD